MFLLETCVFSSILAIKSRKYGQTPLRLAASDNIAHGEET